MIKMRSKLSRLELSVPLPARSDQRITVSLSPISSSGAVRRAANGDLVSVGRASMRKYRIGISGEDVIPPGIQSLFVGDYVECVLPDFMLINSGTWNRVSLDAHESLATGEKADPSLFLFESDYTNSDAIGGLRSVYSPSRINFLRKPNATQIPGAAAMRVRPVFACRLVAPWDTSAEEAGRTTTWRIELEEV